MNRTLLALSTALLLSAAYPAYAAPITTQTQDYQYGVIGDIGVDCTSTLTSTNHGGACFDIPAGAIAGSLRVYDRLRLPSFDSAATVSMYDAAGKYLYAQKLCATWQWISLYPGTASVRIDLQYAGALAECGAFLLPPTEGTLKMTWHNAE